ncbi:hypothetical protein U1Q18_005717 [Sarracenia purpurea var. burkii]
MDSKINGVSNTKLLDSYEIWKSKSIRRKIVQSKRDFRNVIGEERGPLGALVQERKRARKNATINALGLTEKESLTPDGLLQLDPTEMAVSPELDSANVTALNLDYENSQSIKEQGKADKRTSEKPEDCDQTRGRAQNMQRRWKKLARTLSQAWEK